MRTILIVALSLVWLDSPVVAQQVSMPSSEIGRISDAQASSSSLIRPGVLGGALGIASIHAVPN